MDHTVFYTANTPWLPLPRKRSPDGATTDSNSSHLIAAFNSTLSCALCTEWTLTCFPSTFIVIHCVSFHTGNPNLFDSTSNFYQARGDARLLPWPIKTNSRWLIISYLLGIPDSVVSSNTVNAFKNCLNRFWINQEIQFNWKADTDIGSRSQV